MATLTNIAQNNATLTNRALSQRQLKDYTVSELATQTMATLGPKTFDEVYIAFTNLAQD